MSQEYVHRLGDEIRSISGGYTLQKEGFLELGGREVLYAVGYGVMDSTCCGVGGCRYALVPGYVKAHKVRQNPEGLWVSDVEPVEDAGARDDITRAIQRREEVQQVQFL